MSWEEKTITISGQVVGIPRKRQHIGTSRTPANSAAPQGVPLLPSPQQHKKAECPAETASSILASSSYCTCSHYPINSLALFWNLPPPMWNLDNDALEPPTPQKKPRCQKNKKKAQPLKHSQTHATFCWDPLCIYHR